MPDLKLPFWLSGAEIEKLKKALTIFWGQIEEYAKLPLSQIDPLLCGEILLEKLAWQRQIVRLENEDLALYRLRVHHAFVNAQDAGSKEGIKSIFTRLGIRYVEVNERIAGRPWDLIELQLEDNEISQKQALIMELIRTYGRTCRRYEFSTVNFAPNSISSGYFDLETAYQSSHIEIDYTVENRQTLHTTLGSFDLETGYQLSNIPIDYTVENALELQVSTGEFNFENVTIEARL